MSAPLDARLRYNTYPDHQPQQQPLNLSAYATSNPSTAPRLPRIQSAAEAHPYPLPHHTPYQHSYYHATPAQHPPPTQPAPGVGVTPQTQQYGSPHGRGEEASDEQNDSGPSPTDGYVFSTGNACSPLCARTPCADRSTLATTPTTPMTLKGLARVNHVEA